MLETDPDLERSTIHQGIKKTLAPFLKLEDERGAGTVQTIISYQEIRL